jgi:hypothetical protein
MRLRLLIGAFPALAAGLWTPDDNYDGRGPQPISVRPA